VSDKSLKETVIQAYANLTISDDIKDDSDNIMMSTKGSRLLLLTSFGFIEGLPLIEDSTEDKLKVLFSRYNNFIIDEHLKQNESLENDDFILLSDVKVYTSTNSEPFKLDMLNVFLDDIIAVTIGKFSTK